MYSGINRQQGKIVIESIIGNGQISKPVFSFQRTPSIIVLCLTASFAQREGMTVFQRAFQVGTPAVGDEIGFVA